MPTAFKCFREVDGEYFSAIVTGYPAIHYPTQPGESIEHNNIFVFRTQQEAQEFVDYGFRLNLVVWEVEVTELHEPPKYILYSQEVAEWFSYYWDIWKNDKLKLRTLYDDGMVIPIWTGTLLTDKITLVKEVYRNA